MIAHAVTFMPPSPSPLDDAVSPSSPAGDVASPRASWPAGAGVAVGRAARGGSPTDARYSFSSPSWSNPYTVSNALSMREPSRNVRSSCAN